MGAPRPQVVVVGSANTDLILSLDHLPRPGETVLGGGFQQAGGGKGANQAIAAAYAGAAVCFVGRVGDDPYGRASVAALAAAGVDSAHVGIDPDAASGVALIFVDRHGENCIGVASGANARLSPAQLDRAHEAIASARVLLVQLEIPLDTVHYAVELAAGAGVRVVLNPAPAQPLPDSLLRGVDVLTPNQDEAEKLSGIAVRGVADAHAAAAAILQRGVRNVVITLGGEGVLLAGEHDLHLPAHVVEVVDTTAAGDVFSGALAAALAEGCALPEAARFANAAAARAVGRRGAQPSIPRRDDVESLLRSGR